MGTSSSRARYAEHLLTSGVWRSLRVQVLERSGYLCECCGNALVTQVHHVRYHRWGAESVDDLLGCCKECHEILTGV